MVLFYIHMFYIWIAVVKKDNSHPLPACVRKLTFHSELHCHPLSCAAANYKHTSSCKVQHNPLVMDLINPSSAPIPPWTGLLCRKRATPQTIINPSDAWGAQCFLWHQSTEQQPLAPWDTWGGGAVTWGLHGHHTSNWSHSSFTCPRYENTRGNENSSVT